MGEREREREREKIKAERPKLTVHILIATGCTTQEK
jgi:hypothetical protein